MFNLDTLADGREAALEFLDEVDRRVGLPKLQTYNGNCNSANTSSNSNSKFALLEFCKVDARLERLILGAADIGINCICPGPIGPNDEFLSWTLNLKLLPSKVLDT